MSKPRTWMAANLNGVTVYGWWSCMIVTTHQAVVKGKLNIVYW